jgi:o-succinylbenzoate synthase
VLLELRDEEDRPGFGEAAPWPGFGTEPFEAALAALQDLVRELAGTACASEASRSDLIERLRDTPAAQGALAGALLDLEARRAGVPLAEFLAQRFSPLPGPTLASVPVSALLRARDPAALRDEAARARAAGFRVAKLKLAAGSLAEDLGRAQAAREGLGDGTALRGDANGAWTRDEAGLALEALVDFGFEYVEQPLAAEDVEGLAMLRRQGVTRIAADESLATVDGVRRLLDAAAVDVFVLKPSALGGAGKALAIASAARNAGIDCVFTHAFDSAVGARHVLHCAAAWGHPDVAHGLATAGLFIEDVASPVTASDGCVELSTGAGLGITP